MKTTAQFEGGGFQTGGIDACALAARIRAAREALRQCEACEIRCGANRLEGERSPCRLGSVTHCFRKYVSLTEEAELVPALRVTAYDVSKLPPEFTRKGRIDGIYGIYLPTQSERVEIFRIHLGLKDRDPEGFDLEALAEATEGCTGADVKEVVTLGLKLAFHAGKELSTGHLLEAAPEIRPLSQTDPERVAAMTEWLDRHAKPASARGKYDCAHRSGGRRKRCVAV